jgi:CheY-like chemotaxis protein
MRHALATGPRATPVDAALELRRQVEAWVNEGGSRDRGSDRLLVLVIEDEVIIGMLLARVLAGMGHEVIGVEGTEQGAVTAAALVRPGLILVDERLRAGSGHAAIARILRDGFIPHVWMSGNPSPATKLAPGVAVLQKPFTAHALGLAIAEARRPAAPIVAAGAAATF